MDVAMMCYWADPNSDVFETTIQTFRKHSNALLQVHTDKINFDYYLKDAKIRWKLTPPISWQGRCDLCRLELLAECVQKLNLGDRLLWLDADLYFFVNPFACFLPEQDFDIGVTTRHYPYIYPISIGMNAFKITENLKQFFKEASKSLSDLSKLGLPLEGLAFDREKNKDKDWDAMNFFNCLWARKERLQANFGLTVKDLGPYWNFCPDTYSFGYPKACEQVKDAIKDCKIKVLHLKSKLKIAIYEGFLPDAVTRELNTCWDWRTSRLAK